MDFAADVLNYNAIIVGVSFFQISCFELNPKLSIFETNWRTKNPILNDGRKTKRFATIHKITI